MGNAWEQVGRDVSKISRNQILKGLGSLKQEAGVILKEMGNLKDLKQETVGTELEF